MEEGKITVVLEGTDRSFPYTDLGVTYDSSDEEIVDALNPIFAEEGINLKDEWQNGGYMLKRADNSQNIHLFPKSTAGVDVLETVEDIDIMTGTIMEMISTLSKIRDEQGHTPSARHLAIAITNLETAKLFLVEVIKGIDNK